MLGRLIVLVFLALSLSACGGSFDIYAPSQIHKTVKLLRPGIYDVGYKHFEVINEYGLGVENVRKSIRQNPENWRTLWNEAAAVAVPKYLEAKGLVPAECEQGVEVIRSGSGEGGGGWAEFRCK
ncbi:MAG: hypothetical protein RPU62_00680 [Candidatus Sedimenticola sp. (ex Thyasira tokunagai)]